MGKYVNRSNTMPNTDAACLAKEVQRLIEAGKYSEAEKIAEWHPYSYDIQRLMYDLYVARGMQSKADVIQRRFEDRESSEAILEEIINSDNINIEDMLKKIANTQTYFESIVLYSALHKIHGSEEGLKKYKEILLEQKENLKRNEIEKPVALVDSCIDSLDPEKQLGLDEYKKLLEEANKYDKEHNGQGNGEQGNEER